MTTMNTFTLDSFFGQSTFIKAVELYDVLNEEIFSLKDTGLAYKNLKDWDDEGLLFAKREDKASWRKYSLIDLLWIKIIDEFRLVGTPRALIKKLKAAMGEELPFNWLVEILKANIKKIEKETTKENLNDLKDFIESKESQGLSDDKGLSFFLLLVIETITTKIPVSLLLFADGNTIIWNEDKNIYSISDIEKITFDTHISVSVSKVIKSFLYSDKSTYVLPKLNILKESEVKLLEIINSGEYESITINFRNKKMKSLEMVKEQDVRRKVIDIISENKYQDIVIKSHKGMVTKIQNTVKVMLD
jgi:DNA-binding transcriptional MerR regulator